MKGSVYPHAEHEITAGAALLRMCSESHDSSEKGRRFENLFMKVVKNDPDFAEIEAIWHWQDWPDRVNKAPELDGRDTGIDLIAQDSSGNIIAIQCKCYDATRKLNREHINSFLAASQKDWVSWRYIVTTCDWGVHATSAIENLQPEVRRIDFSRFHHLILREKSGQRPAQPLYPYQEEALESVERGFLHHDRGRLIMACGTGKTFTSLRIAEKLVPPGGSILFMAPSIALVSQARREWLSHKTRDLKALVICSDSTAGGRGETEDIKKTELVCRVITDPQSIADFLMEPKKLLKVIFCTYQSLDKVGEAQKRCHGDHSFDLAVADEAHRTTGILNHSKDSSSFQLIHHESAIIAKKRLYMTATPRIYTEKSKSKLAQQSHNVIDMSDETIYGPEFYRLSFKEAVENSLLSDYRVIVLGVDDSAVSKKLEAHLHNIGAEAGTLRDSRGLNKKEITRVLGVSLALNGLARGDKMERSGPLRKSIAFSNRKARSRLYAKALCDRQFKSWITRHKRKYGLDDSALEVEATHLDAGSSAFKRHEALSSLRDVSQKDRLCRILCNVKLFTEGVDVPQLDAVAFLEPRDSQVDIVQAVGRVMRKAAGKKLGYIIIPVVVSPEEDLIDALSQGSEGYQSVGRVLRALQSHDSRLAEDTAQFVTATHYGVGDDTGDEDTGSGADYLVDVTEKQLELKGGGGVFAHIVAASGLGKKGQLVADEIIDIVKSAGRLLVQEELAEPLAKALNCQDSGNSCVIAALILTNAMLLQRRLEKHFLIKKLNYLGSNQDPAQILDDIWQDILSKDYRPIFHPAREIIKVLKNQRSQKTDCALRQIGEFANRAADSLSELGYDHAGPLYHKILGKNTAKSDGAFYTKNLSAIILARLALTKEFINQKPRISDLRIMDPACGTGTLLLAALKVIKERERELKGRTLSSDEEYRLHQDLVEHVLCGLDINDYATQLAASNLTLGAPGVDYKKMHIYKLPNGPQPDGTVKAGSLELLLETDNTAAIPKNLDAILMNPPFTNNVKRSAKFSAEQKKAMQCRELFIKEQVAARCSAGGNIIDSNNARQFFTVIADGFLAAEGGVLAQVLPTTACTSQSGLNERRFIADRFYVETIITSHDPKVCAFSENTSIHESLMICRRKPSVKKEQSTQFIALRKMPKTLDETENFLASLESGDLGDWGKSYWQPAAKMQEGDWRPCQFYHSELYQVAEHLEDNTPGLSPLGDLYQMGPAGRGIRGVFSATGDNTGIKVFYSRSSKLRTTMAAKAEQWMRTKKEHLAHRYMSQGGYLLLASGFDTIAGRLLALVSQTPAVGSAWVPVQAASLDLEAAKAMCAYFNSTLGMLFFLGRRSGKLTNPQFSMAHLRSLPVPNFNAICSSDLVCAFENTKDQMIQPWKLAEEDPVREVLDQACAKSLNIDLHKIRHVRTLISQEPTVSNQAAPCEERVFSAVA
ncbi:MAG: DEAD/DEAH box helicase family protein [Proteobacteria bacterium]|nr:DEAD/DEAH box helicase family protein [Pseudomonadota bacterium]